MIRHGAQQYCDEAGFPKALLLAATQNSQSLDEFRQLFAATLERVRAESTKPDQSTALLFASLGLLLSHTLGFSTLDEGQTANVFNALEDLVRSLAPLPGEEGSAP
jgi:hypothetical protein